jgi:hypothetical protein
MWRDYRQHNKAKVMALDAHEFIRRFLLHSLPDGFHRIRHHGFLTNGHRQSKLSLIRRSLDHPAPPRVRGNADYRQRLRDLMDTLGSFNPASMRSRTSPSLPIEPRDFTELSRFPARGSL